MCVCVDINLKKWMLMKKQHDSKNSMTDLYLSSFPILWILIKKVDKNRIRYKKNSNINLLKHNFIICTIKLI